VKKLSCYSINVCDYYKLNMIQTLKNKRVKQTEKTLKSYKFISFFFSCLYTVYLTVYFSLAFLFEEKRFDQMRIKKLVRVIYLKRKNYTNVLAKEIFY
jgi:hypothetical protein